MTLIRLFVHKYLLQIIDTDGDNDEDKNFWKDRNGCLNLETPWYSWNIFCLMKEFALIQFFVELGRLL